MYLYRVNIKISLTKRGGRWQCKQEGEKKSEIGCDFPQQNYNNK